jgi:hypothetical protein
VVKGGQRQQKIGGKKTKQWHPLRSFDAREMTCPKNTSPALVDMAPSGWNFETCPWGAINMRPKLLIAALLAVVVNGSTPAAANSVYDWQGTCTLGCTGTASGVLTLTDGASPFSFNVSNFVSFQFISSSGTFFLDNTSPYLMQVA